MITLLRTVNSRRWKNGISVHAESHLIMDYGLSCGQICPPAPYVSYSLVLWPGTEMFHAHNRNQPLLVERAHLMVSLQFVFPHRGYRFTAHPSLYVTLFQFHFLSNTHSHHFSIWPNSAHQFTVSVCKSSNNSGDKLSMHNLGPTFSVKLQLHRQLS